MAEPLRWSLIGICTGWLLGSGAGVGGCQWFADIGPRQIADASVDRALLEDFDAATNDAGHDQGPGTDGADGAPLDAGSDVTGDAPAEAGSDSGLDDDAPIVVVPPPKGWWTFDDCVDGAQYLTDFSDYGYHATIQGRVECALGHSGAGVYFDGQWNQDAGDSPNIVVLQPDSLSFREAVTLAAWVKPASIDGQRTIVNKWYVPDSYMLLIEQGQYVFSLQLTEEQSWRSVGTPATAGVWTHVAAVFDGENAFIYVDGVPMNSMPAPGLLNPSGTPVSIGGWPVWNVFHGTIDDVRIWGEALSQPQIGELAQGG